MSYFAPDHDARLLVEKSVINRALKFVNHRESRSDHKTTWALRACKRIGVLPPDTNFVIDMKGRVQSVGRVVASSLSVRRCQSQLVGALETVRSNDALTPGDIHWKSAGKKSTYRFDRVKTVFGMYSVAGGDIDERAAPMITPTLKEFVAYSAAILSQIHWRAKLSLCAYCGDYFLAPQRRGGPRPITCGDRCKDMRGDPTRNDRQKRYRNRQR